MFKNLSIRAKMFLQIGMVLLALTALIGTGLYLQRILGGQLDASVKTGIATTDLVNTARSAHVNFQRQVQQWKNMLIRGTDPKAFEKHYGEFTTFANTVQEELNQTRQKMRALDLDTKAVDTLQNEHKKMLAAYIAAYNANFDKTDANPLSYRRVDRAVQGIDRATSAGFDDLIASIAKITAASLQQQEATAQERAQQSLIAIVVAASLAALAILLAIAVVNGILRNVQSLGSVVGRLNSGDYKARASIAEKDELGQLGGALNTLLDQRLSTLVQAERENDQLNNSVVDIMTNVAQLAQRDLTVRVPVNEDVTGAVSDAINMMTNSTAQALSEVNTISHRVSQSSSKVKERADVVEALAGEASSQAQAASRELGTTASALKQIGDQAQAAGRDAERALTTTADALSVVGATVSGITASRDQIRETEKRVKRLAERSQEISSVVNIIGQIAERTSVLALNASMQAVAAGDAGRGFAVVADEVKRLAENAREATQQISGLVHAIQSDTSETLQAMNGTISQVVEITRLADRAGSQMNDTRQATEALANSVRSISQTTQSQAESSQRLLERAQDLINASQRTLEEISGQRRDADDLNSSAGALVSTVSQFRLPRELAQAV